MRTIPYYFILCDKNDLNICSSMHYVVFFMRCYNTEVLSQFVVASIHFLFDDCILLVNYITKCIVINNFISGYQMEQCSSLVLR